MTSTWAGKTDCHRIKWIGNRYSLSPLASTAALLSSCHQSHKSQFWPSTPAPIKTNQLKQLPQEEEEIPLRFAAFSWLGISSNQLAGGKCILHAVTTALHSTADWTHTAKLSVRTHWSQFRIQPNLILIHSHTNTKLPCEKLAVPTTDTVNWYKTIEYERWETLPEFNGWVFYSAKYEAQ